MNTMMRTTKHATLSRIARELELRRDAIDEQLWAVRDAMNKGDAIEHTSDMVLALYLVAPGAKDVAELCNAFGWRMPGVKEATRMFSSKDIFDLIRGRADGLNPHLLSLALEKLEGRHEAQWGPSGRAWGAEPHH